MLGKIVLFSLKEGCVKLNGTHFSKCIYIHNFIMLNGTLQDKHGEVLLAYIDSLVELLLVLCDPWCILALFILIGHVHPVDLEGVPNHQDSSLK